MENKACNACKQLKPLDCFNKNQYRCRSCQSEYYQKNRNKILAKQAQYEKSEAGKAIKTEYNNSESAKVLRKSRNERYYQTHNGKMVKRLAESRRRARIKKNGFDQFSYEDLRIFWLGQNILDDRCYYCSKPLPYGPEQIDHYIPISKGGAHIPVNLRPSCACCNLRKSNKHPIDFMKENK